MDLIQQAQGTLQQLISLESRLAELQQRAHALLGQRQEQHTQLSTECHQVSQTWQAAQASVDSGRHQIETAADSLLSRLAVVREAARQGAQECARQVEEALAPLRTLHEQLDSEASRMEALRTKTEDALSAASQRALELFEQARRPLRETAEWLSQDFSPRLQQSLLALDEQSHRLTLLGADATAQLQADSQRQVTQLETAADGFRHTVGQATRQLQETAESSVRELQAQQKGVLEDHSQAGERLSKEVAQIAGGVQDTLQQLQDMDARFQNDARSSNQGIDAVLRMAEDYKRVLEGESRV